MIISVSGVYHQYCELSAGVFGDLMGAPSMGHFFKLNIEGSESGGLYDCGNHRFPPH